METTPRTPRAPAWSATATLTLTEWTDDGLAAGVLNAEIPERMAAGTRLAVLGGLPGETVEVEVQWAAVWSARQQRRRRPPTVRLRRVLVAAPERVAAPCPVFGDCGGCRLQHLAYPDQLAWKRARVQRAMQVVGIDPDLVLPTLGMAEPWRFRNQMRFAVDRVGRPGLTALGTHRVIPLTACPIAHPLIAAALTVLAAGPCPRPQVMVRCGAQTGDVLIQPAPDADTAHRLAAAGIASRSDDLRERLGGREFRIRPSSFFQTNTAQAEVLADLVRAAIPSGAAVADAYCGVGTFAALLAGRAGRVVAIEESATAVRDARENLAALGLAARVEVIQGKTEQVLPALPGDLDAVVLDPPRLGCARPVLDALIARRVARVVYVACDPASLARDLALLAAGGYAVRSVQPLDMFPQTYHIEAVAVLEVD